jgi:hypothetical protein
VLMEAPEPGTERPPHSERLRTLAR